MLWSEPGYDVIGVKTTNLTRNINIVAVYRHPRTDVARRDLNSIFNAVNGNNNNTVILGDFNAHNTTWNCDSTNDNGDVLYNLMYDEDFLCINTDTKSRVGYSEQRDSNLDLMFGTDGVVNRVDYQMEEAWDSDRVPISFSFDISAGVYRKSTNRTSVKKTDWSQYQEFVKDEITSSILPDVALFGSDFEKYYNIFTDTLRNSVHRSSGRRGDRSTHPVPDDPNKRKRSHRWWNAECDSTIQDRRSAFAEFRRLKSLHTWINYKRTKDRETEIRNTIDSLAPPFVGTEPITVFGQVYSDEEVEAPFRRSELDRALEMVKRDSAPGLDGVLPADWFCYQVVFIDKTGKEKVRPISLSSCIGKLMERMINEKLIWWAEREEKFSKSQSGFRRGKSCADNLVRITSDIRAALSADEYTLAAFLDVLFADLLQGAVLSPALYSLFTRGLCADLPEGIEAVEFADDVGLSGCVDKELSIRVQDCDVFSSCGAKFLAIWLDNRLNFHRQVQEVKGKGTEVNTALMLYKSLVRSVADYGIFVYFPRDSAFQLKLERTQYMGIRTALGFRNSTPNNVLIAEAKIRLLRDRADMLGRNFPLYRFSLVSEIWRKLSTRVGIGLPRQFEVFQGSYGAHTFRSVVDLDIGKARKHNKDSDSALVRNIIRAYDLAASPEVIYTDGSYDESKRSTGASLVICDQDVAYKISLPYICSSYTAEAFAIKSALQLMTIQAEYRKREIVIMSDCKSVLQSIRNNHLNVHKNCYVTEARVLLFNLERIFGKRVVLTWIPAHVGILGNKLADKLAKEASHKEADPSIEVPVGDYTRWDRKDTWEATQMSIVRDSTHKGEFYFRNFYDDQATKPWFREINSERYFVTLFNRLRANHFNLASSLKRKRAGWEMLMRLRE
ncbi:uncharacterized protein [Temnothorax nylanderi]|uniref:uncharacterized protein n=1 Tax=Temnothorax nylanderi TaxID=102681 RepID=UPI003A89201E